MLDVHPPHHAAHTWKDFWIHLGTITIGLLIAISLEQSVEALHHLHQRHQLEDNLHTEAAKNLAALNGDIRIYGVERNWLLGLRADVDRAHASGGKLRIAYTPKPTMDPADPSRKLPRLTAPSEAVWLTARESSLVGLLPRPLAEMYTRMYWQHDIVMGHIDDWFKDETALSAFEYRFDDAGPSSTPDLARMTPDQLDQYSVLLTRNIAIRDALAGRLKLYATELEAVLNGASSEDDLLRIIHQKHLVLNK